MSVNENELTRKCHYCEKEINIEKDIHEIICYGGAYYHSKCFVEYCNDRLSRKRCKKKKWENALNSMDELQNEAYQKLSRSITKHNIFLFIIQNYDVTRLQTTFYQKLSDVYSGKFKGMDGVHGIPPDHLLDMWKKQMKKLNKIYNNNVAHGREMTPEERLNYDLAVLVNKYDSYLRWLRRQEIIQSEMKKKAQEESKNRIRIDRFIVRKEKENEKDMSALADEIFG